MGKATIKYPAEILDYSIDLTNELTGGDTIPNVGSVSINPGSLTLNPPSKSTTLDATNKIVTFWLGGGTAGTTVGVPVTITTALGRLIEVEIDVVVIAP